jgi:hypothetical protein
LKRSLRTLFVIGSILLTLALLVGLVWANTVYARAHPHEKDFLIPWLGAQTFLRYGNSPYSEPAAQRNQIQYYGRPAEKGEDPLRLGLPLPMELIYFPFALIPDYDLARGLWMAAVEIALAVLAILTLRLTGWKPGRVLAAAVILFSLLWSYALLSLASGSGIALVALALVGGLVALQTGKDELAGALFVLPFFKPDICGVFMLFLLWWVLVHRRGRVVGGFLLTLFLLLIVSFVLLPSWFIPFLRGLISQSFYNPGITPLRIFVSWWPAIGDKLAWALYIVLAVVLLLEWRIVRGKDFRHTLWLVSVTLSATPLIGIPVRLDDLFVLFLPLIFALAILADRWSHGAQKLVSPGLLALAFVLPWSILFGSMNGAAKNAALFLIPPALLLPLLYWERWWATRPPRTWLESLKDESE